MRCVCPQGNECRTTFLFATFGVARLTSQTPKLWWVGVVTDCDATFGLFECKEPSKNKKTKMKRNASKKKQEKHEKKRNLKNGENEKSEKSKKW